MTAGNIKEEYLQLINSFLEDKIGANEFSLKYLHKMKSDNRTFGDDLYDILQKMFDEANSYTDNPEIYYSNPDFYLTDSELKIRAKEIFNKLKKLLNTGAKS